jgi:hypothetical protein
MLLRNGSDTDGQPRGAWAAHRNVAPAPGREDAGRPLLLQAWSSHARPCSPRLTQTCLRCRTGVSLPTRRGPATRGRRVLSQKPIDCRTVRTSVEARSAQPASASHHPTRNETTLRTDPPRSVADPQSCRCPAMGRAAQSLPALEDERLRCRTSGGISGCGRKRQVLVGKDDLRCARAAASRIPCESIAWRIGGIPTAAASSPRRSSASNVSTGSWSRPRESRLGRSADSRSAGRTQPSSAAESLVISTQARVAKTPSPRETRSQALAVG